MKLNLREINTMLVFHDFIYITSKVGKSSPQPRATQMAIESYTRALEITSSELSSQTDRAIFSAIDLLATFNWYSFSVRSVDSNSIHLSVWIQKQHQEAIDDCTEALKCNPTSSKSLFGVLSRMKF